MQEVGQWLHEKAARLTSTDKAAFCGAFIFGLIAHLFILTNSLLYNDSAATMMSSVGSTFSSGRWGLGLLAELTNILGLSNHSALFDGFVSLVFISVASIFATRLLDVRSPFAAALSGSFLSVFPSVASIFAYMYTASYYFFALLLSFVALYVIAMSSSVLRFATGSLILAFSIGVYQMCLCAAFALAFAYSLIRFAYGATSSKICLKEGARLLLAVVLSALCYLVINAIALAFTGVQMASYQGIDTAGQLDLFRIPSMLFTCYDSFLRMKWNLPDYSDGMNNSLFLRSTLIAISLLAAIALLRDTFRRRERGFLVVAVLFVCLTPLAFNSVYMLSSSSDYEVHSLMVYPLALYPVLLVSIFDHSKDMGLGIARANARWVQRGANLIIRIVVAGCFMGYAIQYCYIDNLAYYRMALIQEEATSWFTVLVSEIKGCDNYNDNLPVAFIGEPGAEDASIFSFQPLGVGLTGYSYDVPSMLSNYMWLPYMAIHTGFSPKLVSDTDQWASLDVVEGMPCYPDSGSVAIIDGAVVVKFSN